MFSWQTVPDGVSSPRKRRAVLPILHEDNRAGGTSHPPSHGMGQLQILTSVRARCPPCCEAPAGCSPPRQRPAQAGGSRLLSSAPSPAGSRRRAATVRRAPCRCNWLLNDIRAVATFTWCSALSLHTCLARGGGRRGRGGDGG